MSWDEFEGSWPQICDIAKSRWSELTPHEIAVIQGKRDRLAGRLQVHYGYTRREAEREVEDFAASLTR